MKNDPEAEPPYKAMTCFVTEKEQPRAEQSDGLRALPSSRSSATRASRAPLVYDGCVARPTASWAGEEAGLGNGFGQMMDALEVGRLDVAARGVGIAQRALELALRYSQERKPFGRPIAKHQAIQSELADMVTKVEGGRVLTLKAARMNDAGERSDFVAGIPSGSPRRPARRSWRSRFARSCSSGTQSVRSERISG